MKKEAFKSHMVSGPKADNIAFVIDAKSRGLPVRAECAGVVDCFEVTSGALVGVGVTIRVHIFAGDLSLVINSPSDSAGGAGKVDLLELAILQEKSVRGPALV